MYEPSHLASLVPLVPPLPLQSTASSGMAVSGILAGLAIIVAFFIGASISRRLLGQLSVRVETNKRPLIELAAETTRYVVIVVGLITGFGTMGVDVSALVAGLGLTGFALGFALRDAVSNLIAGVLILAYQPYSYRDRITVAGNSGVVAGINFRYTVLESDGGAAIHVPNSTMFNNSVTVAPRT